MVRVFRDINILFFSFFSLLLNVIMWFFLWSKTKDVVIPIVLHYNVNLGADLTGEASEVFIIPFIGLSLLIVNLLLGYFFYESNHRSVAYFLTGFLPVFQIILLIVSFSIVKFNF